MYTYTTPTITCILDGVDFSQVDYVRVAVESKKSEIVRVVPVTGIDTETGETSIKLTQEETAQLGKGQVGKLLHFRTNARHHRSIGRSGVKRQFFTSFLT